MTQGKLKLNVPRLWVISEAPSLRRAGKNSYREDDLAHFPNAQQSKDLLSRLLQMGYRIQIHTKPRDGEWPLEWQSLFRDHGDPKVIPGAKHLLELNGRRVGQYPTIIGADDDIMKISSLLAAAYMETCERQTLDSFFGEDHARFIQEYEAKSIFRLIKHRNARGHARLVFCVFEDGLLVRACFLESFAASDIAIQCQSDSRTISEMVQFLNSNGMAHFRDARALLQIQDQQLDDLAGLERQGFKPPFEIMSSFYIIQIDDRGQGYGTALMAEIISKVGCWKGIYLRCDLTARPFFYKHGFDIMSEFELSSFLQKTVLCTMWRPPGPHVERKIPASLLSPTKTET
ncbi:hypothetical protein G7054_g7400 [Neopestalotiopsis clavispora]|nr:hypothetical protein G7054_g7400 [Neopestalotiopsis clavispora]